ncbi:hypothetical protein [Psychrobacter alimentarius]|uniref:hypothetical protein n=1 Tax=Psychrobacter alimentarius TaxID=261164 RepID=UPI003FD35CB8
MTVNSNFLVHQTVWYNENGFPVPWVNEAKEPQLVKDNNGYNVVIADKNGNPKVMIDSNSNLFAVASTQASPVPTTYNSQYVPNSNFTGAVLPANLGLVKYEHPSPQLNSIMKRDDIYRKVKKLSVDSVKQLLFYESIMMNNIRLFINFDEEDAYNFLTDQLNLQPDPISKLDHLISIKTYGSIPDSFLNWFSDDLRAGLYFSSFVNLEWFQDSFYGETEFLNWIKSIIKISKLTIEESISISPNVSTDQNFREANIKNLSQMKKMYLTNQIKTRKIKWFDEMDKDQVNWAYDYFCDRDRIIFKGVFFPKTVKDKYNLVLASLDIADDADEKFSVSNGANTLTLTQRDFFIYKMRRAWDSILNTRKKVEQKSKRLITVDKSNFESFSILSTHYKLKPTKMVNKLIEDAFLLINDNPND